MVISTARGKRQGKEGMYKRYYSHPISPYAGSGELPSRVAKTKEEERRVICWCHNSQYNIHSLLPFWSIREIFKFSTAKKVEEAEKELNLGLEKNKCDAWLPNWSKSIIDTERPRPSISFNTTCMRCYTHYESSDMLHNWSWSNWHEDQIHSH